MCFSYSFAEIRGAGAINAQPNTKTITGSFEFLDRKGIGRSIHEMSREVIRKYIVYSQDEWVKFEDHYFKKDEHMTKRLAPGTINTLAFFSRR
ncbi:integrase/recombinase XerD [Bacillus velezensis]|nr:integrase/recombinase XerD [Bacillus velezensis]